MKMDSEGLRQRFFEREKEEILADFGWGELDLRGLVDRLEHDYDDPIRFEQALLYQFRKPMDFDGMTRLLYEHIKAYYTVNDIDSIDASYLAIEASNRIFRDSYISNVIVNSIIRYIGEKTLVSLSEGYILSK